MKREPLSALVGASVIGSVVFGVFFPEARPSAGMILVLYIVAVVGIWRAEVYGHRVWVRAGMPPGMSDEEIATRLREHRESMVGSMLRTGAVASTALCLISVAAYALAPDQRTYAAAGILTSALVAATTGVRYLFARRA